MMKTRETLCALWVLLWITGASAGFAQAQTSPSPTEKLQQEFTDPLTILPQVFFRDTYTPANFGTHVQTNAAVLRATIPRIPPNSLLPFDQLIRPTFTLVTVPSSRGGTRTEFGDMQLFDLAFLPWAGERDWNKDRDGPYVRLSHRDLNQRGSGCVASRSGICCGIYRSSVVCRWFPVSESGRIRIHLE